MCIKQISVFAKNRPGRIKRIAEVLSSHSINIRAITIASGDDYGIIKLIVNEPEKAFGILKKEGFSVALNKVLAVKMKDTPGGLYQVLEVLADKKINLEDAYGFVIKSGEVAVLVINVVEFERAKDILLSSHLELLQEKDLYQL